MIVAALLIVAAAVYLMVRRVEVRLVLLVGGLLLAVLAGKPLLILDTFTRAMVAAMVAPICASMGFAALLKATGCDRHLVGLLLAPLRRARWALLPGSILAAYLVNLAIPSQASTAAALGPILIPLLMAAEIPPETAGAALLLGASFGGDLLNPGAQDVQSLAGTAGLSAPALSTRVVPAGIAGILCAALIFALLQRRKRSGEPIPGTASIADIGDEERLPEQISLVKAAIPLLPIALLLLAYAGVPWLRWLTAAPSGDEWRPLANALPVVRAMLIGSGLAVLVGWREIQALTRTLFEGMGTAYAGIISLTITAQCFGAGIAAAGVSGALIGLLGTSIAAAAVLAVGFPWALALLSGSGSGPVLTYGQTFLAQMPPGHHPVKLAALACLAGAFGRTMSPVSAVTIYCSGLVGASPVTLVRRLAPALLCGALVAILAVLTR